MQAQIYDDLYAGRGKDYAAESSLVASIILDRCPGATSLLDVGCGTGGHLRHLRSQFADVSGLEPSAPMRAIAATALPDIPMHSDDMRGFSTGRSYDAVICMFSVIGYAGALTGLHSAIAAMAAHLNPGGVLVIEPWLFPDRYDDGHVGNDFTKTDRRVIFRMSHSGLAGRVSILTMHYLVGERGGVRHFSDVHRLTMFTRAEFAAAFAAAGLTCEFLEPVFGRGIFIGCLP